MNSSDKDEITIRGRQRLESRPRPCPACGGMPRRAAARFCATCGRTLGRTDYLPTDQLRASYHLHHRHPLPKTNHLPNKNQFVSPPASALDSRCNLNSASTVALDFATYALVPYFGTIFCISAIVMGCVGLLAAARTPHIGGRLVSLFSIAMGLLTFCVQLFLWWTALRILDF